MTTLYPFLADPAAAVLHPSGLGTMSHLGAPKRPLTLRLMAIEAAAMTDAMAALRRQGVLAMPVYDSLIVPQAAKGATLRAMKEAFVRHAGIAPSLKPNPPDPWDF